MEFQDKIKEFSARIPDLKKSIETEEATKMSLIVPMFQMLGYDVFNPEEFKPEYIADIGVKKGEKVDYAIMDGDEPSILIECKNCGENLDLHVDQLYRYFGTTRAKFGILTDGVIYRFFTDLEDINKMDEKPFLEVNVEKIKDGQISELKKFHKENFDKDKVFSAAEELKYTKLIRDYIQKQLDVPSEEFVKFVLSRAYSDSDETKAGAVKKITKNRVERYSPLVKKVFNGIIADIVNQKLTTALETTGNEQDKNDEPVLNSGTEIVTTDEELRAFYIVQGILAECVDPKRVVYRDVRSYFGILFDDNNRKPICRINLDVKKKWIAFPDANKDFEYVNITSLTDIYKYKEKLISVVKQYM